MAKGILKKHIDPCTQVMFVKFIECASHLRFLFLFPRLVSVIFEKVPFYVNIWPLGLLILLIKIPFLN